MLYDAGEGLRAYLAASPLAWLFATIGAYVLGVRLYERCGRVQIVNPILVAVVVLSGVLWLAGIDYANYFAGAQFVHFLLGPVTVLLAVPLYRSVALIRRSARSVLISLLSGSLLASITAMLVAGWLGADDALVRSLAAKSVTTPIALGITEALGGITSITAVIVVFTGVIGGIMAGWVFRFGRVSDPSAMGFALGLTSHGIGIGRAVQIDTRAAAFATLGVCLNGVFTALWVPAVVPWLLRQLG